MKLKVTILLIFVIISISTVNVFAVPDKLPFDDISESSWYCYEVKTVYEAGIMEGKSDNIFDPSADMSRAEFVTVLCRLSGDAYTGKGNSLNFSDTQSNAWYADYVAWGVEAEMVKGLPGNKFAPNQAVSRQEMAVFIDRFINYKNIELSNNSKVDSFNDKSKVTDYAKSAVETMRKSGIITGDQNGNFNPANNASRAEVATVITRILPLLDNDIVITPPDIDRENFDEQEAFMFGNMNANIHFPYRVFLPEGYSSENEYPLVVFIGSGGYGSDNVRQLNNVGIMFESSNSPIYESIVVVPQAPKVWHDGMATKLSEFIEYVNGMYSTDSERQYIVAAGDGCWTTWRMLVKYPKQMSAALLVHGVGVTLGSGASGEIDLIIDDIPSEFLDLPIHLVHDTDDGVKFAYMLGPKYGEHAYKALTELAGCTNIYLTETEGYGGGIKNHFVSKDDISLLEWLFAQHRETK